MTFFKNIFKNFNSVETSKNRKAEAEQKIEIHNIEIKSLDKFNFMKSFRYNSRTAPASLDYDGINWLALEITMEEILQPWVRANEMIALNFFKNLGIAKPIKYTGLEQLSKALGRNIIESNSNGKEIENKYIDFKTNDEEARALAIFFKDEKQTVFLICKISDSGYIFLCHFTTLSKLDEIIDKSNQKETIATLPSNQQEDEDKLIEIAKSDLNPDKRSTAIYKIKNQEVIAEIAKNDTDKGVRATAINCLKNDSDSIFRDIAKTDQEPFVRGTALEKISDQKVIMDIAMNDRDEYVLQMALKIIKNDDDFKRIENRILNNKEVRRMS